MKNVLGKIGGAFSSDKGTSNSPFTGGSNNNNKKQKLNKNDYIQVSPTGEITSVESRTQKIVPTFNPAVNNVPPVPTKSGVNIFKKETQYPVLQLLGIPLQLDWDNLISDEDIDEVGFTLTAPTGLDPDEVEQFCDSVQNDIREYRRLLELKQKHFVMLLEENAALESKLIEQQQENELANFIIESKSSEEKLKEELVDLRLENSELKQTIAAMTRDIKNLKEIAAAKQSAMPEIAPPIELRNMNTLPELPNVSLPNIPEIPIVEEVLEKNDDSDFSDVFDDLMS